MPQFLLRMLIAITLLTVEIVLATAFVAHFTKPVENLKMWFRKHYRVTLAVVFPVLLATNVGLTFLFSGGSASGDTGVTVNPDGPALHEHNSNPDSIFFDSLPDLEQPEKGGSAAADRLSPAPIPGYAADRTMRDADTLETPTLPYDSESLGLPDGAGGDQPGGNDHSGDSPE